MAQINPSLVFKHVQVTNAAFTNVAIPINCNKILIRNGNESGGITARITSDVADAEAFELIPAGDSIVLEPNAHGGAGVTSYIAGENLCAAKSDAVGNTDLFFTFLK